jgi:integrase
MRRRKINDGLPHRVYERRGLKIYSIGYKSKKNNWVFRLQCDVNDAGRIRQLRREAVIKATSLTSDKDEIVTIKQLFVAFFEYQDKLTAQPKARGARKPSTIAENKREAATLCTAFGEMAIEDVKYHHAASYQDKCDELGRGAKADKEITLLSKALNFARRRGLIEVNPLTDIEKLPSRPSERYVTDGEMALALQVGRRMGGAPHIVALAFNAAYLCTRRSVEVRDLKESDLCTEGIWWTDGKTPFGVTPKKVLIEWSNELRELIEEARAIRPLTALGPYVFGNLDGEKYTRHGWKPGVSRLMGACRTVAQERGIPFNSFSLMDLRPKGVSDKLDAGDTVQEVADATLHKSTRMVEDVYDRRKERRAKPVSRSKDAETPDAD